MQSSALNLAGDKKGSAQLKVLATNGFSAEAAEALRQSKKRLPKAEPKTCYLCNGTFERLAESSAKSVEER